MGKNDDFFVYLEKNYLRVDSKFKPSIWSCFNSVNDAQELLHSFKCDMIEDYDYAMQNNRLNRQRPQTIHRKTAILDIMEIFSQTDLFDPENLVHYALRFANYDNSNLPQFGVLNLTEL